MKWLRYFPMLFFFYNSASRIQEPATKIECKERHPFPQLYVRACRYDFDADGTYEKVTTHVERDDNNDGLIDYIEDCVRDGDYSIKECAVGYSSGNIVKAKYPVEL